MFQFPGFASLTLCIQVEDTWLYPLLAATSEDEAITTNTQVGCPIRTSMDQSLFPAPHGLTQGITSFIASCCLGIHQTPLSRLIRRGKSKAAPLLQSAAISFRSKVFFPWWHNPMQGVPPVSCTRLGTISCLPEQPCDCRPDAPLTRGHQHETDVFLSQRCQTRNPRAPHVPPDDPTRMRGLDDPVRIHGNRTATRANWWSLSGSNR
jgi:hypothetical protein